mmetsp:Transcript_173335/g.550241  ORF Transcript_173335/g.550241 Transcript_173335/m.550241 type:complete len:558 (+) Transcript_173335:124-1797(+)
MRHSSNATEEHFAGGRSLKWYVCAGSLMLTNLSTEQLVGLNGAVFQDGCLAGIWWEAGAALAMIVTATVFLPKYFALGLTTTTGFLGERYDLLLPTMVSVIFLLYYTLILCPLVLYTGALAIRDIFDLDLPLWVVSTAIGLLGAAYALFGGLTAVAVSDCLNGIGLLIAGLWVPIAALQVLPGGLISLFEEGSSYLQPLVATSMTVPPDTDGSFRESGVPSVPWHVTLTGLALTNMYYWSTNQVIVQRVLAAESLSNGQKGVLFAAIMKVVGFTMLCLPGIIGIMMVKGDAIVNDRVFEVGKPDEVYARIVKAVMPEWSFGFVAAVLLGSVLSTFNSALNSASTIFGLEIYQIYINPEAADGRIVMVSTIFGALLTLLSFVIAPQLAHVGGIFNFLQKMNSIVSLPIVTVFVRGHRHRVARRLRGQGRLCGRRSGNSCQPGRAGFALLAPLLHLFRDRGIGNGSCDLHTGRPQGSVPGAPSEPIRVHQDRCRRHDSLAPDVPDRVRHPRFADHSHHLVAARQLLALRHLLVSLVHRAGLLVVWSDDDHADGGCEVKC